MRETIGIARDFVRHWWLLVAVTTIAAAGVTAALGYAQPSAYTASATIELDTLVLQRWPELGSVDTFLRALQTPAFASAVATASGLGEDLGGGRIAAYSLGEPPNRVAVTFTSPSEEDAGAVARVIGGLAVEHFRTANAATFERQRTLLDNDRSALGGMEPLMDSAAGFDRLNAEYLVWAVKNAELGHAAQLRELDRACRLVAEARVTETKPHAPLRDVLGAALLGLVAGIGIAYAFQYLSARRAPV